MQFTGGILITIISLITLIFITVIVVSVYMSNNFKKIDTELTHLQNVSHTTSVGNADALSAMKSQIGNTATELTKKTDLIESKIGSKADTSYVDKGLALKSDTAYVNTVLGSKADVSYVDNALELKADKTYVDDLFKPESTNVPVNYYTKSEVDSKLKDLVNAQEVDSRVKDFVNAQQVDSRVKDLVPMTYLTENYYTKDTTDTKLTGYNTDINAKIKDLVPMSYLNVNYDTRTDVDNKLSKYDTRIQVDDKVKDLVSMSYLTTNYDTRQDVDTKTKDFVKTDIFNGEIAKLASKTDTESRLSAIDSVISTKIPAIEDALSKATASEVTKDYLNENYLDKTQMGYDYYDKDTVGDMISKENQKVYTALDELEVKYASLGGEGQKPDLSGIMSGYYTKDEINGMNRDTQSGITQVNSKVQDLTSKYTTVNDDLTKLQGELDNYYTKSETDAKFYSINNLKPTIDDLKSRDDSITRDLDLKVDKTLLQDKYYLKSDAVSASQDVQKSLDFLTQELDSKVAKTYLSDAYYNKTDSDSRYPKADNVYTKSEVYPKTDTYTQLEVKTLVTNSIPVGTILAVATEAVPDGFFLCDGRELSRNGYQALYKAIGTTYGNGKGNGTTFNLPNIQGRTLIGVGQGDNLKSRKLGETGGIESVVLNKDQLPEHSHSANPTLTFPTAGYETFYSKNPEVLSNNNFSKDSDFRNNGNTSLPFSFNTNNTGKNLPHENMQPFISVQYCIKY